MTSACASSEATPWLGEAMKDHDLQLTGNMRPRAAVAILTFTVFVFSGFFFYQAFAQRNELLVTLRNQESSLERSKKVKTHLDALANGVAKLAAQGDVGAQEIVQALKRDGVKIVR